jgi:hypothetical protein
MPTTANCVPVTNENPPTTSQSPQELIATPFGHLTREEIREWEKMLGAPLLQLPTQS